jgi:hypothetical protein
VELDVDSELDAAESLSLIHVHVLVDLCFILNTSIYTPLICTMHDPKNLTSPSPSPEHTPLQ